VNSSTISPYLSRIQLHPIKSLDPIEVPEARIGPGGGLEHDRGWALFTVDGRWLNAKRTAAMHLIRAAYAPDLSGVTLSVPDDRRNIPARSFQYPADTENAAEWFSVYFDQQIIVRHSPEGFPDDTIANGPTIISTASLDTLCRWFPEIYIGEIRLRFRTTLEISGVPAFWEDQLFGEEERSVVRFHIGEVCFEGSNPCARCPVPSRNPWTGEASADFQKRFTALRRAQLPPWSPVARFDHFYRLSTNTRIASIEHGKILRVGDLLVPA
jgi:uncharacterized protein YcbX